MAKSPISDQRGTINIDSKMASRGFAEKTQSEKGLVRRRTPIHAPSSATTTNSGASHGQQAERARHRSRTIFFSSPAPALMRSPICWSGEQRGGASARTQRAGAAAAAAVAQFSPVGPGAQLSRLSLARSLALAPVSPVRSPVQRPGAQTVEPPSWCPPAWPQPQCRPALVSSTSCVSPGPTLMETLHPGGAAAAVSTAFRVFSSMLSVGPNKGLKISPTKAELDLDTPHSKFHFCNLYLLRAVLAGIFLAGKWVCGTNEQFLLLPLVLN